jgi:DNA-binding IclR family transcriptional regulator
MDRPVRTAVSNVAPSHRRPCLPPRRRAEATPPQADAGVSRAPAVARVAAILRLLSATSGGLGVNEIARRVGLVPSTCLHILRALVDEGFVAFDPSEKRYRMGVGLLALVRDGLARSDFPQAIQPALDRLAAEHGATAVAVELDNRERMVVVAIAQSDAFVSLRVNVGSRFPAFISATGRCVAAALDLSRDELKARFDKLDWAQAPDFGAWLEEIDQARLEGVAVDRENYIRGVTVVATLLPDSEARATRGVALIGISGQLAGDRLKAAKKALARLAETHGSGRSP